MNYKNSYAVGIPGKAFSAPTGTLVDLFEIFNGNALYDPERIMAPALILRGEDDTTSSHSDAEAYAGPA